MRFAQCLQGSRNTGDTAPFRGLTVVGYAKNDLTNGYSLIVAPFCEVGQDTDEAATSINKFIPVDSNGQTLGNATFQLQTKNAQGGLGKDYVYLLDGDDSNEGDGWFSGEDWCTPADKTFKIGESFLFNSGVQGGTLTFDGQVVSRPLGLKLINGYQLLGNPRPTALPLANIIPVDADGNTVGNAAFQLQTKNAQGGLGKDYVYLLDGDDSNEGDGWFSGEDWCTPADLILQPCDGFLFNSALTGAKLIITELKLN